MSSVGAPCAAPAGAAGAAAAGCDADADDAGAGAGGGGAGRVGGAEEDEDPPPPPFGVLGFGNGCGTCSAGEALAGSEGSSVSVRRSAARGRIPVL